MIQRGKATRVNTENEPKKQQDGTQKAFNVCIPVNKSSLTTIDIFQLKILANRRRINVNWYSYRSSFVLGLLHTK